MIQKKAKHCPNPCFLTIGDVCEISGLSQGSLSNWCKYGWVHNIEGGTGNGDHRRFSEMHVIGACIAKALSERSVGCVTRYQAEVVLCMGRLTLSWLDEQFAIGNTHWLPLPVWDPPYIRPPGPYETDCPDVVRIAARVKEAVARVQEKNSESKPGRRRGLAGTKS